MKVPDVRWEVDVLTDPLELLELTYLDFASEAKKKMEKLKNSLLIFFIIFKRPFSCPLVRAVSKRNHRFGGCHPSRNQHASHLRPNKY